MSQTLLVVGAGAIGRGYLPWLFQDSGYEFLFVDSNPDLVAHLRQAGGFTTYRVRSDALEGRSIRVAGAFRPDEFDLSAHANVAACFFCVGPRQVAQAAAMVRGCSFPLILCENDPATVEVARAVVGHNQVFFAVPDVITSNTAPPHLLEVDPLAVVTEDGTLFVEAAVEGLIGEFSLLDRKRLIDEQWAAKLYLHNTPHCIAAYLGAAAGATYVHEAMNVPEVGIIVEGAMTEMLSALRRKGGIAHDFLDWYAAKELSRFRCPHLFDPIARVAREPIRKLEPQGRLIGAAQLCLLHGVMPYNVIKGIFSALDFNDQNDPDRHLSFMRQSLPAELFNTYVLGLRHGEPLDAMLRDRPARINGLASQSMMVPA